jgi:hypothetical protein
VGVSGATILMVRQVKRLERLLKSCQEAYEDGSNRRHRLFDMYEDLRDARDIAKEENARLQEENVHLKAEYRRLRHAPTATTQETEDEL